VVIREARSREELVAALALRRRVFYEEQGIRPEADQDGRDDEAMHVVAVEEGALVGTCRLVMVGDVAMLGRLAVERSGRRHGVGRAVLEEAERAARAAGARRVALHAQLPVKNFYEQSGYSTYGEVFMEEGIDHVAMEKRFA
jgi:predicted GNAT family N-acyltransferase